MCLFCISCVIVVSICCVLIVVLCCYVCVCAYSLSILFRLGVLPQMLRVVDGADDLRLRVVADLAVAVRLPIYIHIYIYIYV